MGYEVKESNNLIFTYDFISNKWKEIGFLDQRGTHVHTCTLYQSKNDYRYLSEEYLAKKFLKKLFYEFSEKY